MYPRAMSRETLSNWRVRYVVDGLILSPPGPEPWATVRIHERAPLQRASRVVTHVREQLANGGGEVEASSLERIITHEGEFGALATVTARRDDGAQHHVLGFVWGDHFGTRLDGTTNAAPHFDELHEVVRALTKHHVLGLGELRRRRFEYSPPETWRAYPRGLIAEWRAPAFPNDHGFASVFPARPIAKATTSSTLDRALHEMSWRGYQRESSEPPTKISGSGIEGQSWCQIGRFGTGKRLFCELVVLADRRFHYVARFECLPESRERHQETFRRLVASMKPLPLPTITAPEVFEHWVD